MPRSPKSSTWFAGSPRTNCSVLRDQLADRALDADQVVEVDRVRLDDRHEAPRAIARVPAEGEVALGDAGVEGRPGMALEPTFREFEHALDPSEQS